jgi:hypothetical protein
MAKHERDPIGEERSDTVIYGADGAEMFRFGFTKWDYEEDGAIKSEQVAENIECGDGTITSAAALIRTPGALRVCDICRTQAQRRAGRSRVTFSLAANMKTCASCHKNLCSRHAVVSRIDGQYRCRRCNRWMSFVHLLRRIARALFFREV